MEVDSIKTETEGEAEGGGETQNWITLLSGLEFGKNSTPKTDLEGESGKGMGNESLMFQLLTEWLCGELGGEEVSLWDERFERMTVK